MRLALRCPWALRDAAGNAHGDQDHAMHMLRSSKIIASCRAASFLEAS